MQKEAYFYQQNVSVLKFNIKKEQQKILFNHYISQKENWQRTKQELPRGYFYMSINTAAEDIGISVQQIRTLIKQFTELGIIKKVEEFPRYMKKPTIWEYVSCSESNTQLNRDSNNQNNIHKARKLKPLSQSHNNQSSIQDDNQKDKSKKELFKDKILNIQECDDVLRLFSLYPNKMGKEIAVHLIGSLIEEYGVEQIERCINRYVEHTAGKEKRYMKYASTFFEYGYRDYLDENYQEDRVPVDSFRYDEETGEVIR